MSPFNPNLLAQTVTFRDHLIKLTAAPQRATALLRIPQYSVQLRYRPDKKLVFVDPLSRQPCEDENTIELYITITVVQFSTQKLQTLRLEMSGDADLLSVITVITSGLPECLRQLPTPLRAL